MYTLLKKHTMTATTRLTGFGPTVVSLFRWWIALPALVLAIAVSAALLYGRTRPKSRVVEVPLTEEEVLERQAEKYVRNFKPIGTPVTAQCYDSGTCTVHYYAAEVIHTICLECKPLGCKPVRCH